MFLEPISLLYKSYLAHGQALFETRRKKKAPSEVILVSDSRACSQAKYYSRVGHCGKTTPQSFSWHPEPRNSSLAGKNTVIVINSSTNFTSYLYWVMTRTQWSDWLSNCKLDHVTEGSDKIDASGLKHFVFLSTSVVLMYSPSFETSRAIPKSATFAVRFLPRSTFRAARSRWTHWKSVRKHL